MGAEEQGESLFEPVSANKRHFEHIVENIRRAIYTGTLEAGQQLPSEPDLARQFNVSRSAVREALKVLELSGLLTVRRGYHGGTFVSPPDFEEASEVATLSLHLGHTTVDQLTEAREVIEIRAAELAATRCSDPEVATLEETIGQMEQYVNLPARFITADIDFHMAVAEMSQNNVFVFTLSAIRKLLIRDLNRLIVENTMREAIIQQHCDVLGAIKQHDPNRAGRTMRSHLQFIAGKLGDTRVDQS